MNEIEFEDLMKWMDHQMAINDNLMKCIESFREQLNKLREDMMSRTDPRRFS